MDEPRPGADKEAWRDWAKRERERLDLRALSPAVVGHLAVFEPLYEARTIMLYYPMAHELDVTALEAALSPATVVAATRTPPRGPLTLHRLGRWPLERHRYGFLQPAAEAPLLDPGEIDVALVPGLCFAGDGTRLGHGAGYFDEFLARVRPDARLIGVAPTRLVVEELPRRSYDVVMTHLATELAVSEVG